MESPFSLQNHPESLTVTELNLLTKDLIAQIGTLNVTGELSTLTQPRSGHLYFTLKDKTAQVRCAMYRQYQEKMSANLQIGERYRVTATPTLYTARGEYQLQVRTVTPDGEGALQKAFLALKEALTKAGLFDITHKKPLPKYPNTIGIITSPTGAALSDILTVLKRRAPAAQIIIYPCSVQGALATEEVCYALKAAAQRNEVEVIILARGGGSLEDLWTFNEEAVARNLFDCPIPVVTGVGHETDTSIADFVADCRASTPTAAAERVTEHLAQAEEQLRRHQQLISLYVNRLVDYQKTRLAQLKLSIVDPAQSIRLHRSALKGLWHRLVVAQKNQHDKRRQALALACQGLSQLSPISTIARGYAIAEQAGRIIRHINEADINQALTVRVKDGRLVCHIDTKLPLLE